MPPRLARALTTAAITLLALGACDLVFPTACTTIGCAPSLTVTLSPAPTAAYSVALIVPDAAAPPPFSCPDPTTCGSVAFFPNVSAPSVTVVVTVGDDEFRRNNVRPTYTTSRPNGSQCAPTCRQGAVTVTLPSAGRSLTER